MNRPVAHLSVDFQGEPAEITLDNMVLTLLEKIPGAIIGAENWYAKRRKLEEATIATLRSQGRPMHYADHIVGSVDRAEKQWGPAKEITIPTGKGSMCGRISRRELLLVSECPIDQETVELVLAVLRPLGIVKDFRLSND